MDRHEYDMLLGRLAVHFKVLSKDQVGEALKRRRMVDESLPLGPFLVDEQYVTPEVLAKLDRAREQYLKKQGLTPPDPGDQTQPVGAAPSPVPPQPVAPQPVAAQPVAPQPVTVEPAQPVAVQALTVDPVVEPILEPDPPAADEAPITLKPASVAAAPAVAPVAAVPVIDPAPVAAAPAPAVAPGPVPVGQGEHLLHLDASTTLANLLQQARQLGASDLHLHSQAPIRLRLNGGMQDAGPMIDPDRSRELVMGLLSAEQRALIEEHLQLDFSYEIPGVGRFRSNAYRQQKGWDAVFRVIPPK
ncbi:MAG: hypothetical protein AAFY88_15020, partial [Acidobacteriota bacterium]